MTRDRKYNKNYILNILIIVALSVFVFCLSSLFELGDRFLVFSRQHENWEIDEIMTVAVFLMIVFLILTVKKWRHTRKSEKLLKVKNRELLKALSEVKQLKGIIPICSSCKTIRDDEGYWQKVEVYLSKHSDAQFSHGICPDCVKKYFPGYNAEVP